VKKVTALLSIAVLATLFFPSESSAVAKSTSFQAEVWADNWFSLYINGKLVGVDSTPFNTERSFNSEKITFKATYPLTVAVIARDYIENESGLEYIGKPNQQIGDAGFVLQIKDLSSGNIVGWTDKSWKSLVVQKAPLNSECVTSKAPLTDCQFYTAANPKAWYSTTFKDSSWKTATEFSESEVGVKEGYLNISWSKNSKLIWSSDLKLDNTVLLRSRINAPKSISKSVQSFSLTGTDFAEGGILPKNYTCDGTGISPGITWSTPPSGAKSVAIVMDSIPGPARPGETESGNHYYFIDYNIPINVNTVNPGATNVGTLGKNFLGKGLGYTPPCSQGPGLKIYTITAYALSEKLTLDPNSATGDAILKAIEGKIVAKAVLNTKYERS
jgi:phosphatidylethanolamine-binding protein (PEBP) family uncharacterized protein